MLRRDRLTMDRNEAENCPKYRLTPGIRLEISTRRVSAPEDLRRGTSNVGSDSWMSSAHATWIVFSAQYEGSI